MAFRPSFSVYLPTVSLIATLIGKGVYDDCLETHDIRHHFYVYHGFSYYPL